MKMNRYVNVRILKFFIIPFFLGLAVNLSCSLSPRVQSTHTPSSHTCPTATQGSSAAHPPMPEAQQFLTLQHK